MSNSLIVRQPKKSILDQIECGLIYGQIACVIGWFILLAMFIHCTSLERI